MAASILFEAETGRVTEPTPRLQIEEARGHAGRLLGSNLFRSFNACVGVPSRSMVANFIRDFGDVTLGFHDMLQVKAGEDTRTVLGFDLVIGRPGQEGTTYERPVGHGAAEARLDGLDGKSFGYVPLEGSVGIAPSGRELEVAPGQVLLPEDGEHRVRIPPGNMLLELVMTESPAGPDCEAEWSRYSRAQPQP